MPIKDELIHAMIREIGDWRKEQKQDSQEIRAEIHELSAQVARLDAKIDAVREELGKKIDAVGRRQEVSEARVNDVRAELRHTPRLEEMSDLWKAYRDLQVRVGILETSQRPAA